MTMLSESKPVARKQYDCDASIWIYEGKAWWEHEFTYAELREVVKARRNHWRILPGQQYVKRVGVWSGELRVFRAIPAMDAICLKYDLYEYE